MSTLINEIIHLAAKTQRRAERKRKVAEWLENAFAVASVMLILVAVWEVPHYLHGKNCKGKNCDWFWCDHYHYRFEGR